MVRKLKTAIIGCGIGLEHLQDGFAPNDDKFDVVAICDLREDLLNEIGERFDIPHRTTRYEDILAMADVDVIDLCTPPTLHFPQAMAALAAGKHVICEKPIAGSLAEVDQLAQAARKAGKQLLPIFQYRFGTGVAKAKHLIDSGLAGKPYLATAETFWHREKDYYNSPWRGRWQSELGGVLTTQSIHIHDLLTYLMGPVSSLFGRIATRVNAIEVEDCASASLEMQSGALVSLSATLGSQDQISRLRLMFENITIESNHSAYTPGDDPWTFIARNGVIKQAMEEALDTVIPIKSRFEGQFALFHASVIYGKPLPVTLDDARSAVELVTAFYSSAQNGNAESFPLSPNHPLYHGWWDVLARQ